MGTSQRYTRMTVRASWLLLLVGLAPACTVSVEPGAVVIDLPGFGGSSSQPGGTDAGISGSGGSSGGEPLPDAGAAPDGGGCSVVFVSPAADDVPVTLGPVDDGDGTPCGSTFTTDVVLASSGASVTLFVDGTPWAAQLVSAEAISFDDVLLGSRTPATSTLRAVATMADGSSCETTLGPLGVDCAGPTCTLSGPNNEAALTSADDTDAGADGLQTSFSVNTDPENSGTQARLILDGNVGGALTTTVDGNTATFANVTLAEGPARTVQGECSDQFGNITRSAIATWSVTLDHEPSVEIVTPETGTIINLLGTSGATADLSPGSVSCETEVVVRCSVLDASVVLLLDGALLPQEAQCEADEEAVPPFVGTATFPSVSLSELAVSHTLAAQQSLAGLVGTSSLVIVDGDCAAPAPVITEPLCGGQLHVVEDDSLIGAAGLQHDVAVSNDGVAQVALSVARGDGSETLSAIGSETLTFFPDVDFGGPGDVTLTASATDELGNLGTASCLVTVVVEPTVNILAPSELQVLSTADDCEPPGGGFGITVSGTTSAAVGGEVAVAVGAAAPTLLAPVAAGGGGLNTFSGCIAIADGVGQTLTVTVTDEPNPPGGDIVSVSVDTLGPTESVLAPLASVTNRRQGQVTFTWDHVTDADGSLLAGYDLRCAPAPIGSEGAWTAARQLTVTTPGAGPASAQAAELIPSPSCTGDFCRAFRVGATEFCTVRGRDIAGALTPLDGGSGSVAVSVPFVTTPFTGVLNGNSSFTNVVGLGDVNGDGAQDMLYGVTNLGLQLFFGATSPGALDTSADVSFTNGGVSAFGAVLSSVGDVNGDGIGDFAASARALSANAGTVYLFFGRPGNTWPSSITVNAGGCGADVCLVGSAAGGFFGWDITGTDFNGDGTSDLVISARAANAGAGLVYVILGGTQLQVAPGTSISVPSGNPNGFVLTPPASRSNFGVAIAAVGAGGDGRGDLAIAGNGAGSGNPAGLFYLQGEPYPGGSGLIAPAAALLEVAVGSSGDYAAPSRAIGDFDGDGLGDLAVGRNFSSGGGLGIAELYRRNGAIFTAGPGFRFEFTATGADNDYGTFVATGLHPSLGDIGDLDGDGRSELAVGSLAGASGGSLALFYGESPVTGRVRSSADFTLAASTSSLLVPNFVGDVDGDGFDDLAVVDGGAGADRLILLH